MKRRASFGLLTSQAFRNLWIGQTISLFGSHIGGSALRYTALLLLVAGPQELALLSATALLPVLVLGLPAGAWVDRLRRRPVLVAADLARALLLFSVPVAYVLGVLRIEQLYVVAIATGALTVVFDTAYHSYVPSVVERERLVEANSKLGMSDSVAEIAGPPLGGLLVQLLTAPFAVLFDALSFVLSALAIRRIRGHEPPPVVEQHGSIGRDIAEGLRTLLGDARLRALLGCSMTRSLGGGFYALYELYLVRDLGFTPALVGLTIGAGGIGALAGAFLAEPLVRRLGMGRVLIGAQIISSVVGIILPLAHGPLVVTVPLLIAMQLSDVAYAVYAINETSIRQSIVPERLLGRVASSFTLLTTATLLVGTLLGGAIGAAWGARAALALAVAIGMCGSLWLLASPFRQATTTKELHNAV